MQGTTQQQPCSLCPAVRQCACGPQAGQRCATPVRLCNHLPVTSWVCGRYCRIWDDADEALQPEWEIDPKDLQILEKVGGVGKCAKICCTVTRAAPSSQCTSSKQQQEHPVCSCATFLDGASKR